MSELRRKLIFFQRACALLTILINPDSLFAQPSRPQIAEPTVASFAKFIDNPVSTFNGSADVSIPIYTLKDGDVEIPITLRYATSGIKVAEEASWVGLGFNLSVGGSITQSVVHDIDDPYNYTYVMDQAEEILDRPFYPNPDIWNYYSVFPNDRSNTPDELFKLASFTSLMTYRDLEPDIYYFNFGSYSGKFFIDYRDGSRHIMNKNSDIKFDHLPGANDAWRATTEDGSIYTFSKKQITAPPGTNPATYASSITYFLTSIQYPNGQNIEFQYWSTLPPASTQYTVSSSIGSSPIPGYPAGDWDPRNGGRSEYDPYPLHYIITDNYVVEFITSNREDFINERKLDKILIHEKTDTDRTRTFSFTYSYFTSTVDGNYFQYHGSIDYITKRLKLLSIQEEGLPGYSFEYNNMALPVKTSYANDYWGFYNGEIGNTTCIPKLNNIYFYYPPRAEVPSTYASYGANRACNPDFLEACTLQRIIYPTKGSLVIDYEPNTFTNYNYPTTAQLQAIEETPVTLNDVNCCQNCNTYDFQLFAATRLTIEGTFNPGLGNMHDMIDSEIVIFDVSNWRVYRRFQPTLEGLGDKEISFAFDEQLPAGHYTVSVSLPDNLGEQCMANSKHYGVYAYIRVYAYPPPGSSTTGAGLRVKKITQYGDKLGNNFLKATRYEYGDGTLMSRLLFDLVRYNVTYDDGTGNHSGYTARISGNSAIPLSYDAQGGLVGYSTVKIYDLSKGSSENAKLNGYQEHSFTVAPPMTNEITPSIPNYRNGLLNSVRFYNDTGVLIKETKYDYGIERYLHVFYGAVNEGRAVVRDVSPYNIYPITSRQILKTSEREIWYTNQHTVGSDLDYNDLGQVKTVTTTDSKGETTVTTTSYVSDYTGTDAVLTAMKSDHLLSPVVSKQTERDGEVVYKELNEYAPTQSTTDPTTGETRKIYNLLKVKRALNGVDYNDEINLGYNTRLTEFKENKKAPVTYLWGYNHTRIVAEIRGISFSTAVGGLTVTYSGLQKLTGDALRTQLAGLRTIPGAVITTYVYDLLKGITDITDTNGKIKRYGYDSWGRLSTVRDNDNNLQKTFTYHYAN